MDETKSHTHGPYHDQVIRASLPEVMHSEDVALALGISNASAQRGMRLGKYGLSFKPGKRLLVLRKDFMAALESYKDAGYL
jgi:hypothetical protein